MASPPTSPAQYPARVVRYGLLAAPPREEHAAAAPVGLVSISVVSWLADMINQWNATTPPRTQAARYCAYEAPGDDRPLLPGRHVRRRRQRARRRAPTRP